LPLSGLLTCFIEKDKGCVIEVTSIEQAIELAGQANKVQDVQTLVAVASWLAEHGGERERLQAVYYQGVAALYLGDVPTALPRFNETLARATEADDVAMMANVLTALGNIGMMQGDYASALDNYGKSLELHATRDNKEGIGLAYRQRGGVLMFTGSWPEALEELTRALAIYEELGDNILIGQTLNSLGTLYTYVGDITNAVALHFRALSALEDAASPNDVAFTYGQLGSAYAMHGEVDRAVEHFTRALQYYEEVGARRDCIGLYGNIGLVTLNNGRADEAAPSLRRSCELARELGAMHECAFFTEAYAQALFALGRTDECRALIDAEQELFSRFEDVALLVDVLRAKLHLRDGDLNAARTLLEQTLQRMDGELMAQYRLMVHEQLQDIAKQQADFDAYLTHDAAIKVIREEREGKETTQKIAFQEKQREMEQVVREHQKHMNVLHSALPKHIADRVARGEVVQDHFECATVLFADLVGFTTLSASHNAEHVVALLDKIFGRCDDVIARHGLFKIKTIGDSYMAVSFTDVVAAAHAAADMMTAIAEVAPEVQCRIGLHCGPVVAGIIGSERMQYDVWGDTVNVASRMESSGMAGRIHISAVMADELRQHTTDVELEPRGEIEVKGKGIMSTFWLERIAPSAAGNRHQ
jgi:adenylate cyclase